MEHEGGGRKAKEEGEGMDGSRGKDNESKMMKGRGKEPLANMWITRKGTQMNGK